MKQYLEQFIFHCTYEKNLSQKTIKAYTIDLEQFIKFLSTTNIKSIDKSKIRDYVKFMFDKNYKARTINRKITVLKTFFLYLEIEEIISISPFHKLKLKIKEPISLPKTIKLNEIKKLLKFMYQIKASSTKDVLTYKALVRDIAVVELLFATGARVAEICSLSKKNINLSEEYILVVGKGDKERRLYFCSPAIKTILKEYMSLFSDQLSMVDIFFLNRLGRKLSEQSVRFMINKYSNFCNIRTHITPHMFRHSMATYLLEGGTDIRYIQSILGHSSISTTQIYTKVNQKQQKKILMTKHPRVQFGSIG